MNEDPQITNAPIEPTFEVLAPEPVKPPVRLRHATSLANLWHVWIGLRSTAAPSTVQQYHEIARRFCKFFAPVLCNDGGLRQVRKLDKKGVLEWMQFLQNFRVYKANRPLSAARINKINSIAKAFLKWMKQMDYIHEDLAACIPHLMMPAPKESVVITEEEYEKLKRWCSGNGYWQSHLWLCILGYRTGMSLIDCCHLRWKDVHLNEDGHSYIEIRRIKLQRFGEKAKCTIPIVPMTDIHLWLLNLKNVVPWKRADGIPDYVCQEAPSIYKGYGMHNIEKDFRTLFRRAGLPTTKTFKCFRNSLCSNLVNSGMQLALVCTITGHNSVKTLLRYLKPDRRALQDGLAVAQQYSSIKNGVSDGSSGMPDGAEAFL